MAKKKKSKKSKSSQLKYMPAIIMARQQLPIIQTQEANQTSRDVVEERGLTRRTDIQEGNLTQRTGIAADMQLGIASLDTERAVSLADIGAGRDTSLADIAAGRDVSLLGDRNYLASLAADQGMNLKQLDYDQQLQLLNLAFEREQWRQEQEDAKREDVLMSPDYDDDFDAYDDDEPHAFSAFMSAFDPSFDGAVDIHGEDYDEYGGFAAVPNERQQRRQASRQAQRVNAATHQANVAARRQAAAATRQANIAARQQSRQQAQQFALQNRNAVAQAQTNAQIAALNAQAGVMSGQLTYNPMTGTYQPSGTLVAGNQFVPSNSGFMTGSGQYLPGMQQQGSGYMPSDDLYMDDSAYDNDYYMDEAADDDFEGFAGADDRPSHRRRVKTVRGGNLSKRAMQAIRAQQAQAHRAMALRRAQAQRAMFTPATRQVPIASIFGGANSSASLGRRYRLPRTRRMGHVVDQRGNCRCLSGCDIGGVPPLPFSFTNTVTAPCRHARCDNVTVNCPDERRLPPIRGFHRPRTFRAPRVPQACGSANLAQILREGCIRRGSRVPVRRYIYRLVRRVSPLLDV